MQVSDIKRGLVEELHKPARRRFLRRKIKVYGISDLIQVDLAEIPHAKHNRGYYYILLCINAFTKKIWALPMKTKTGIEVTKTMEKILKKMDILPKNLTVDMGKEFYNSHFKNLMRKYKINMYSVFSTIKASIAERAIRTIKSKIWKMFNLNGNFKWVDKLSSIVDEYNNQYHRTIGMKPSEVKKKDENSIYERISEIPKISTAQKKIKYKVGDHVRISKHKGVFDKGYLPNWSAETFIIKKVQTTFPRTYLLEDLKGNTIKGAFYSEELQKTKFKDAFLVNSVIRRKGNFALVRWLGYPEEDNSWIHINQIL